MKRFLLLFGTLLVIAGVALPKDLKADDSYLTYEELRIYEAKKQEDQWSADLTAHAQKLVGKRTGQCVLALRNYFGVPRSEVQGLAKNTKINSPTGKVGSVIVFKYNHVGISIKDTGDGWYYFNSNMENYPAWNQNGKGRIDWIAKNDPRIKGYRIINYKKT